MLPCNLLAMTFGDGLNLSLEDVALPSGLLAVTFDYELNLDFIFVYARVLGFSIVIEFNLS